MFRHAGWTLLAASAVGSFVLFTSGLGGCQDNGTGSGATGGDGGGSTTGTNTGGGATVTSSGTTTSSGSAGGTGTGGQVNCAGPEQTISDITTGTVGPGIKVQLTGVIAMSQKFLVSKSSSSGSCLWGVFVSAPGLAETAANSGILILSYGTNAVTNDAGQAFCPKLGQEPAGDKIPDDVAPGDELTVVGETDYFLLSQCASEPNGSTVAQRQLSKVCSVERTATGKAVPLPHKLTAADIAKLGDPNDTAFHDQWGGVKVQIDNITPVLQGGEVVGMYGIIQTNEGVEIHDKLYYRPYSNNKCHDGPVFDPSVTWNSVTGFSYLDFCTWAIEPNDKCADFDPSSSDCMGALTCPPDI